ncbi:hypothetical protein LGQ02_15805 [Bacillus shivajii]|uniref:hypothetical protein n=1 Tax=Bacillus shivajii TaxID=1983719 RepID=UPI001CFA64BB|nr:hypothetical protein [Bacillus shivajii]UCZ52295.1 hypothetical protein LGQ02_15805 [Bacillus shivajii]
MKKKVLVLSSVLILCATVWSFLLLTVLQPSEKQVSFDRENNNGITDIVNKENESIAVDESEHSQENNNKENERNNYEFIRLDDIGKRGIHKGDFDHIAPDKLISVDVLLEEVLALAESD